MARFPSDMDNHLLRSLSDVQIEVSEVDDSSGANWNSLLVLVTPLLLYWSAGRTEYLAWPYSLGFISRFTIEHYSSFLVIIGGILGLKYLREKWKNMTANQELEPTSLDAG